jgi:hypothetical protein
MTKTVRSRRPELWSEAAQVTLVRELFRTGVARRIRVEQIGASLNECAKYVGTTATVIDRWEKGLVARPRKEGCLAYAAFLIESLAAVSDLSAGA